MPGAALSLALAGAVLALPPLVQAPAAGGDTALGTGWRITALPKQKPPVTRFAAERVDGRDAVRMEAQGSYGNLAHDLPPGTRPPAMLHWAWRMQQPNATADLHVKAGDDTAAKVCMTFDMPVDQVPFSERQMLTMARAITGQAVPAATLCWAWGRNEQRGEIVTNAFTRRVRYIVLRNATDANGAWVEEHRNVANDFLLAFGAEAQHQVPNAMAVGVGADADNTGAHTVAHVAGVRFEP